LILIVLLFGILQGLAAVQYFPGVPVYLFPLFCQGYPLPCAALDQTDIQRFFKGTDMGADRGLGQEQLFGGLRKAALFCSGNESLQLL
jgi:hypothetical protein